MVDFIEDLYRYAQLIPATKKIIRSCYSLKTHEIKYGWKKIQELVPEFCIKVSEYDVNVGNTLYNQIARACANLNQEYEDIYRMGDELSRAVPLMYRGLALLGKIDVTDGNYRLFSSLSGFLTMERTDRSYLFHSEIEPMEESLELAKSLYKPEKLTYNLLGCGLGYVPWQIFCLSDQSVQINIFHTEYDVVKYALDYGVLSWIPEDKLNIIIDNDQERLLTKYCAFSADKTNAYYSLSDITMYLDDTFNMVLNNFILLNNTARLYDLLMDTNIYRNIANVKNTMEKFVPPHGNDEWIVVVAGPSLDAEMEYVRENVGKKNIICASTILKKLLGKGIVPDCVSVLDPQARTYGHFEGLENQSVPLLMYPYANWRFGELYEGEKYLTPNYSDVIKYFPGKDMYIQGSGTTVSSLCIAIAIAYGAKIIHLVGLDLAYPEGKSHASGTMDFHMENTSNMIEIDCQSGGKVMTTKQFAKYIDEINEKISYNKNVTFVNHSKIGARFDGSISFEEWQKNK